MAENDKIIEVILNRIDKLEENFSQKLEKYSNDLMNLKYDVKNDFDRVNLRLDSHEKQIENIVQRLNRPLKERILEIFSESMIKTVGVVTAIALTTVAVTAFGTNVSDVLKAFLTSIF